jgi:hypothetical protein
MIRNNSARESLIENPPAGSLTALEGIPSSTQFQPKTIGTVSFPVRNYWPICDNTRLIAKIIEKRQPALLLCAGWSVPTEQSLNTIIPVTQQVNTVVVLETCSPTPVSFRLADGKKCRMGEQFFSTRADTDNVNHPGLCNLANALPHRSFPFAHRDALLLVCGEVMVVSGRNQVGFHRSVPHVLRNAVRAPTVMILNPTHTRMGNCGTIQAWRTYLSSGGRLYVSASNWDLSSGQQRSATLHSLWHNGVMGTPAYTFGNHRLDYREWHLP